MCGEKGFPSAKGTIFLFDSSSFSFGGSHRSEVLSLRLISTAPLSLIMDLFTIVLLVVAILFVVFYFLVLQVHKKPNLPGPTLLDILPGGQTNIVFRDVGVFGTLLNDMSKKYGDVFQFWLGPKYYIITAVPEDIIQITTNRDNFERAPGFDYAFEASIPGSLFTMPRSRHQAARRKLRDSFNYSMLHSFHRPMINSVDQLIDELNGKISDTPAGQPSDIIDINAAISAVACQIILNVAFGFDMSREERQLFAKHMDCLIQEIMVEVVGYPLRQILTWSGIRDNFFKRKQAVDSMIQKVIEKRLKETEKEKAGRASNLLDAILLLEDHDLTSITSQAVLFALAGTHTTAVAICSCLFQICQDDRIRSKIEQEVDSVVTSKDEKLTYEDIPKLEYLTKVWKETLRLYPPAMAIGRYSQRDTKLKGSGVMVPKNTIVLALTCRSQTHECRWTDADKFIPERWGSGEERGEGDEVRAGTYAPFSIGSRNCPGQFMAEYEGVLILGELLRRFQFSLGCDASEVVSRSGWVQVGRYSSKKDGNFDMGIPLRVQHRDGK